MDAEKQSLDSAEVYKHQGAHASTGPLAVKYLRAAQHVFAVIGISFIARAIERNRQVPGITSEEKALLASSIFTFLVLLFHIVAPYKRTTTMVLDALTTSFLFATFVYGAVHAGGHHGACKGPKKIGFWNNGMGCESMSVSVGFSAVGFATFAASTVVAALK